jgi:hypothetical protein
VSPIYLIHIGAGGLGLVAGFTALAVAKGAPLHRRSGMLFVYGMLVTAVAGTGIALMRGVAPSINVPASLLTAYLVITALTTVRPIRGLGSPPAAGGLMLLALAVGLTSLWFGIEAAGSPDGTGRDGMPAFPFFMFGVVGTLAAAGDFRVIRSASLQGARRLARHLWRMCFALFIAALSFFIGQARVFPEPIRIRPLLAMPVLLVLVTMGYWLWRVRVRRSLRGIQLG